MNELEKNTLKRPSNVVYFPIRGLRIVDVNLNGTFSGADLAICAGSLCHQYLIYGK